MENESALQETPLFNTVIIKKRPTIRLKLELSGIFFTLLDKAGVGNNLQITYIEIKHNGKLRKNNQRQFKKVTITPPTVGPNDCAMPATAINPLIAIPRLFAGNETFAKEIANGKVNPTENPWQILPMINCISVCAIPINKENKVKKSIAVKNTFFWPKQSPIMPPKAMQEAAAIK